MYRQAPRSLLRTAQTGLRSLQPATRRLINTAPPPQKSRSWKSSAARWGVAIAGIYFYNTHPMFADNATRVMKFDSPPIEEVEVSLSTLDSYSASRKQQQNQHQKKEEQQEEQQALSTTLSPTSEGTTADDPAALEEEADSQGAFNPATGEINWDCPCLGGMAHGPCGEDFRKAFSCFVYSEQEPKGLDCIDKFKGMQDCFREHPDVYAAELEDDEELDAELAKEKEAIQREAAAAQQSSQPEKRLLDDEPIGSLPLSPRLSSEVPPTKRELASQSSPKEASQAPVGSISSRPTDGDSEEHQTQAKSADPTSSTGGTTVDAREGFAKEEVTASSEKFDEDLNLMPKAWHDGTDAKDESKK